MNDDSDIEDIHVCRICKGKRKICVVNGGISDSEIININRRRRLQRVESESEDESGTILVHKRGKNKKMCVVSTTIQSQTQSKESGNWSDSSDGRQSEKCPICLLTFKTQDIGSPETCDHTFCVECIQEWSKNVNTCPVDRQEFTLILVRRKLHGRVVRRIPVTRKQAIDEFMTGGDGGAIVDLTLTYCEICGQNDREDRMLLCDACDLGYHMECLEPPLGTVPVDEWYCSDCSRDNSGPLADAVDIYEGELLALITEMEEIEVDV